MLLEDALGHLHEIRWDFEDVIRRPSTQGSVMLHFRAFEDEEKSLEDWRKLADVYGGIVGLAATLLVAAEDDLTITSSSLVQNVDAEQRALQTMRNHRLGLVKPGDVVGERASSATAAPSTPLQFGDSELSGVLAGFQGHKVLAHWTRGNVVSMLWDCGRIMEVVYDAWGGDGYDIGVYEDLSRVRMAVAADWLVVVEAGEAEATAVVS